MRLSIVVANWIALHFGWILLCFLDGFCFALKASSLCRCRESKPRHLECGAKSMSSNPLSIASVCDAERSCQACKLIKLYEKTAETGDPPLRHQGGKPNGTRLSTHVHRIELEIEAAVTAAPELLQNRLKRYLNMI